MVYFISFIYFFNHGVNERKGNRVRGIKARERGRGRREEGKKDLELDPEAERMGRREGGP